MIIASNHINALDPFFIFALMPMRIGKRLFPITFLGKVELFSTTLKNTVMSMSRICSGRGKIADKCV